MKKRVLAVASIIMMFCVTGCAKGPNLTTDENNMIAEYVAGVMLQHSYVYQDKYSDLNLPDIPNIEDPTEEVTEEPTEEITEEPTEDDTGAEKPSRDSEPETTEPETEMPVSDNWDEAAESLGLKPLKIKYNSYVITKEYPDDEDSWFTFEAEPGYTFVVGEFTLTNGTATDVTINNSDLKPVVRLVINDDKGFNNYGNLMLNDMTNMKNVTIKAGESYEAIIVFMVGDDEVKEINKLVLKHNEFEVRVK